MNAAGLLLASATFAGASTMAWMNRWRVSRASVEAQRLVELFAHDPQGWTLHGCSVHHAETQTSVWVGQGAAGLRWWGGRPDDPDGIHDPTYRDRHQVLRAYRRWSNRRLAPHSGAETQA